MFPETNLEIYKVRIIPPNQKKPLVYNFVAKDYSLDESSVKESFSSSFATSNISKYLENSELKTIKIKPNWTR